MKRYVIPIVVSVLLSLLIDVFPIRDISINHQANAFSFFKSEDDKYFEDTKVIESYRRKRVGTDDSRPLNLNIVVDPKTKVEYIYAFLNADGSAITPRLDKNGNVMIYDENK